jgi:hypothetical protein
MYREHLSEPCEFYHAYGAFKGAEPYCGRLGPHGGYTCTIHADIPHTHHEAATAPGPSGVVVASWDDEDYV